MSPRGRPCSFCATCPSPLQAGDVSLKGARLDRSVASEGAVAVGLLPKIILSFNRNVFLGRGKAQEPCAVCSMSLEKHFFDLE